MTRAGAEKKAISDACDIEPNGSEIMILNLLKKDADILAWFGRSTDYDIITSDWYTTQRHHIYGRPISKRDTLKNYRCNIIRLFRGCHDVDKRSPKKLELCCLFAQRRLHLEYMKVIAKDPRKAVGEHLLHWDVMALGECCGRDSLEGRIEIELMPAVAGTGLEKVALDLLIAVREDLETDLPF